MIRARYLAVVALGVVGCASTKPATVVDAKPYTQTLELAKPAGTVFDTLVSVVNASDMRMNTVSKESGVLEVAPKTISSADMDRYCEFPVTAKEGKPAQTFVAYDKQLVKDGKSGSNEMVTLSFLVAPHDKDSCSLNLTANWSMIFEGQTVACKSKGVFEAQLIDKLNRALLTPSK